MTDRIIVLDPTGEVDVTELSMAPRPPKLEGRVTLLWNNKSNGDRVLEAAAAILRSRPGVDLEIHRKPTATHPLPEAVLARIAGESIAVVNAIAD